MTTTQSKPTQFKGNPRAPVSPPLDRADALGIHQVLSQEGEPTGNLADPDLPRDTVLRMYKTMSLVRALDERGWKLQRAGRIEFWIPCRGQEASHVASTAAMNPEDWVFIASREPGSMLYRGAPLVQLFAQFFGRHGEPCKGRRLPLLMGDRRLNILPCITVVGSYIPHASGAAWAAKLKGDDLATIVYFGDGATSRGEFHSAMNWAGIHKPRTVFFCQNNGWAVSTPNDRQTASETFAEKGDAYKVRNLRVDGNDPLAIFSVVREARERSKEHGATLVEGVTYRLGFHTSSDNPDLYRSAEEAEAWRRWDPVDRLRKYCMNRGYWTEAEETSLLDQQQQDLQDAIDQAEAMAEPPPGDMFDDVFEERTWMLQEQHDRLLAEVSAEED